MTFKLRRSVSTGPHVDVSVFVGVDRDHLQLAGQLRLQTQEWYEMTSIFAVAAAGGKIELVVDTNDPEGLPLSEAVHLLRGT